MAGHILLASIFVPIGAFLLFGAYLTLRGHVQFLRQVPQLRAEGWTYETVPSGLGRSFSRAYPFTHRTRGFSRALRGTVQGTSVLTFRYTYYNARASDMSVAVLTLPRPLPRVMKPSYERWLLNGSAAFPRDGAPVGRVLVSLPSGNGKKEDWSLWTEDPSIAHAVFTERVRDLTRQRPVIAWRIDGHAMIAWTGRFLGPRDRIAVAERCNAILREIPSWVWGEGARNPDPWPGPCPERPA